MKGRRQKLTKTIVDQVVYPYAGSKRQHVIWDSQVPSFGLRVYPSGRKAFMIFYRHLGEHKEVGGNRTLIAWRRETKGLGQKRNILFKCPR